MSAFRVLDIPFDLLVAITAWLDIGDLCHEHARSSMSRLHHNSSVVQRISGCSSAYIPHRWSLELTLRVLPHHSNWLRTGPEFPGYELVLRALTDSASSLRQIFIISESPLRKPTTWLLRDDPSDFKELDELGGPDAHKVRIV
ncbi:hypothetical protein NUW54_g8604 [Trametes sanguinea]|uniref:Uncharacterized protein n=1 Tax=Trametes sanguinea TaxID=158606 RepID=A0ACC1PDR7_9APHY|nr:hypothetical protein NUW54_g8604 [Trametes sanguinea]